MRVCSYFFCIMIFLSSCFMQCVKKAPKKKSLKMQSQSIIPNDLSVAVDVAQPATTTPQPSASVVSAHAQAQTSIPAINTPQQTPAAAPAPGQAAQQQPTAPSATQGFVQQQAPTPAAAPAAQPVPGQAVQQQPTAQAQTQGFVQQQAPIPAAAPQPAPAVQPAPGQTAQQQAPAPSATQAPQQEQAQAPQPLPAQAVQGAPEAQPASAPASTDASPAKPEQATQDIKGIDTVDIDEPQGNWLFKRIWWQRAQTQYEKIKALVDAIMEARLVFFSRRTEWDKKIFDPFYLDVGLGRGVLEEIIDELVSRIQGERSKQGDLTEEERALLNALESEKATLEAVKKDIQTINDIDAKIDEAVGVLIQQINKARGFEHQSWQNFKTIGQELNDKKARELFYGMSTYWQNINEIGTYIQGPFYTYFEALGKQAQDLIAKVSGTIKELKEKGIDLKKQWQIIENKAKHGHEKPAQIEPKKQEAPKPKGFIGNVMSMISTSVSATWQLITTGTQALWDFTFGRLFKKSKGQIAPIEQSNIQPEQHDENSKEKIPEAHSLKEQSHEDSAQAIKSMIQQGSMQLKGNIGNQEHESSLPSVPTPPSGQATSVIPH